MRNQRNVSMVVLTRRLKKYFLVYRKKSKQMGGDTPKADVYGKDYEVYHLGYGVEVEKQFPMIAAKHRLPFYRLGKTADVLHGGGVAEPTMVMIRPLGIPTIRENMSRL
jgi:phosphopentomutase